MSDVTCDIQGNIMETLARLKKIPISKVIRNAGRDFARAAMRETPVAIVSKSEYYKYFDERDRQWKYLHQSMLNGEKAPYVDEELTKAGALETVTYTTKSGKVKTKTVRKLAKVRVYKGWSKASWIGVFRALGMPPPAQGKQPDAVTRMSQASEMATDYYAEMTIDDAIHFDQFGRHMSSQTVGRIAEAGYEAAAKNITKEIDKLMQKQWEGQK